MEIQIERAIKLNKDLAEAIEILKKDKSYPFLKKWRKLRTWRKEYNQRKRFIIKHI